MNVRIVTDFLDGFQPKSQETFDRFAIALESSHSAGTRLVNRSADFLEILDDSYAAADLSTFLSVS